MSKHLRQRLGLGCATFGREIDQQASFAVMDHALAKGIGLFDTAEAYGGGQARASRRKSIGVDDVREATGEMHSSERIIGRWLKSRGCRDRIILQTKVLPPLSRQRVLDSIDASLNRLGTDRIDIFMFHAFDAHTPLQESLAALQTAMQAGKILATGCSNFSADQIQQALMLVSTAGLPRLQAIQCNYNLAIRDIERQIIPLCRQEDLILETYSPLGAGFLTGKYNPSLRDLPSGSRFHIIPGHRDIYFTPEKFELLDGLARLSQRAGIAQAQLALAWVTKNSSVDHVLIGARHEGQIDQAIEAMDLAFQQQWEAELFSYSVATDVTKEAQHA
jgi:aryl-alcohol dehydrogenase-like predicted oxidoreductase